MNLSRLLQQRAAEALRELVDDPAPFAAMVRPAQDARFGDYQLNCAMPLAGQLKQKPRDVAERIVSRLSVDDLCDSVEIAGPGFINLTLKDNWLTAQAAVLLQDERLGVDAVDSPRKIIVDFSSPNVAKPMHVGHLRSTVIGDTLCRILRFLGHNVVSDNHIGDWGTQFGMIIYGYKHFLDADAFECEPVAELSRLYRLVNQLSDYHAAVDSLGELRQKLADRERELEQQKSHADPNDKQARKHLGKLEGGLSDLQGQVESTLAKINAIESDPVLKSQADAHLDIGVLARQETAQLHAGDKVNTQLWNRFLPDCLVMLHAMYDRLGIAFDLELGESFYQPMLAAVVDDLEQKGLARESDGAMCAFVEGNKAPFIIRKQDGAFTYATTDLATIRYRIDELKADEILYVVDARQSEHFKLLFETAMSWGYRATEFRHVSFGTILGEDKRPFKTRSGDTVGLESLIDEAITEARKIVDETEAAKPDDARLGETERQEIARAVGTGGLKYADLRHNRDSDYVFSWKKMLAKDGDTSTYIQYAHARVCGIVRQTGADRAALRERAPAVLLTQPEERALLLQIIRFAEAVQDVAIDNRPNLLTQCLFETANLFSSFYDKCHVKNEPDPAVQSSRLVLCDLTACVLKTGLALLGIDSPEQM